MQAITKVRTVLAMSVALMACAWAQEPSSAVVHPVCSFGDEGDADRVVVAWAGAGVPLSVVRDGDAFIRLSFPIAPDDVAGEYLALGRDVDGDALRLDSTPFVVGQSAHLLVRRSDVQRHDGIQIVFAPHDDKGELRAQRRTLAVLTSAPPRESGLREFLEPHEVGAAATTSPNTVLTCREPTCTVTYRWIADGELKEVSNDVEEGTVIVVPPNSEAVVTCNGCE